MSFGFVFKTASLGLQIHIAFHLCLCSSARAGDPVPPKGGFPVVERLDLQVRYADGFLTLADVRFPDPARVHPPSGGWPCLAVVHMLTASRKAMRTEALHYAKLGYITVAYDVRGQGAAITLNPGKGTTLIGEAEKADLAEIFHKTKVYLGLTMDEKRLGVLGTSQGGYHSFSAAAWSGRKLPHPRGTLQYFPVIGAVAPRVSPGNGRKFSPEGNAFSARLIRHAFANSKKLVLDPVMKRAMQTAFLKQDIKAWNALIITAPDRQDDKLLRTTKVPIFSSNSLDDFWNQAWINLDVLNALPATTGRFFLASTGHHGTPINQLEEERRLGLETRWFGFYLKGISDEITKGPRYRIALTPNDLNLYQNPASTWQHRKFTMLPQRPQSTLKKFYLRAGGVLASSPPKTAESPDVLKHQVATGFGPKQWVQAQKDYRLVLAKIPAKQVAYRSAPLAEDFEHIGRAEALIKIRSAAPNLQIAVALLDEDGQGNRRYVSSGFRALRGRSVTTEDLVVHLGLAGYIFRKGHRIVVACENIAIHRPGNTVQIEIVPYFESATIDVRHELAAVSSFNLALEPVGFGLRARTVGISASNGGTIPIALDGAGHRAGLPYVVLSGFSGALPGTSTPFGTLPLNADSYTTLSLSLINTPIFANFAGLLDSTGKATPMNVFTPTQIPLPWIGKSFSFVGLCFEKDSSLSFTIEEKTRIYP